METQRNFKLFLILIISLSLTILINNLNNPLFRLKAQLRLKSLLSQKNAPEQLDRQHLSINQTFEISPTQPLILPTNQPTTVPIYPSATIYLSPTSKTISPSVPSPSPKQSPTPISSPTLITNPTLISNPTTTPKSKPNLVWRSVFQGVSAAENSETGEVLLKIDSGTQYVVRTYTLADGRQVNVLVPLFKK